MKDYIINNNFLYMEGEYDDTGRLCTRVYEKTGNFLVDKTSIVIINDTLNYIGYDYKGAVAGSKSRLGNIYMCPVMVCPFQGICIFSNKSFKHSDCKWFNFNQIRRASRFGSKTKIEFFNDTTIIVNTKITSFNSKLVAADQLIKNTKRRDS